MRLSPAIVLREIQQQLLFPLHFSQISTSLTLKRPVFLADQTQWPENTICIAEGLSSSLLTKRIPKSCLLLIHSETVTKTLANSRQCFFLKEDCSLPGLFNQLQELFNLYDEWDDTLQKLFNREDTLQSLLDASYPVFKNPLVLRRADFLIQAYSGIIDEKPELNPIINPVNSYETITLSKTDPVFLESLEKKHAYFLPEYLSGSRELCCNLFDHGVYSHRLIVSESLSELNEEHFPLLEHLAEYVHLLLHRTERNPQGDTYPLEELLTDIITQKLTDYTMIHTALSEYGWYSSHSYCCMTIKMSSSMGIQNATSNYLCRHFEEIIPGSCSFRHEGAIIVFVNLSRYDNTVDGLLNNTIMFLRDSFLKTGISNPVSGILDLRYCYIQAKLALEYGGKYQPFRWVHKFDDITIQYFMECCLKELPVHMACSSRLLVLKEHDRLHNSDYYNTLKVYLQSHLNAVQASKRLFIHRSTFLYRLEKIQELINVNFEDSELLFFLAISYHILELDIPDSVSGSGPQ
ncbi:MAG: helix-turn-helix domain-containing protein [Lachnospiraceae bacterium]|nr:helix-turn-helix domain-containing protein [Lachnospiraceae bacterium]